LNPPSATLKLGGGGRRRVIFVGGVAGVYFSNTGLEQIRFSFLVKAMGLVVSLHPSNIDLYLPLSATVTVVAVTVLLLPAPPFARMAIIAKHTCRRYLA